MRFSANLSFLFKDTPFAERFRRARQAGFAGVEFMWPGTEALAAVERAVAETGLEVALFNFDAGDIAAGDRGLLSDPERHARFRENVPVALEFAARIGCTRLNALVGVRIGGIEPQTQLQLARENVAWAADQARGQGASIMIEAVNSYENGPYLLDTTAKAIGFLDAVAADNVLLQYDVYHMQRMEGNLADTITRLLPRIGHVQVADPPTRGEPGTGEINYRFILGHLERSGYGGWVGLEYNPSTPTTEESLGWIKELGHA
ncbi:MAG TPA: TIM barrel protein [Solirubrobacteraceae bacterium]|nr:TIM barrel protein [Solirubrobacteraceae bacterium]